MKQNRQLLSGTAAVASVALICCLLWGSAFSGVKIGYELLDIAAQDWSSQMVFAGVRFFIAGIMALIVGSIGEHHVLLPKKTAVPKIIIISFFQTIAQYFFYYIGLAHTTGVKASIIVAANVFTAILISSLLYRQETLTVRKIAGCCVGFAGIVLANAAGLSDAKFSLLGDGFIFLCTVASGFSQVYMKRYSAEESPVLLSGWQFAFGGAVMWIFGAVCGGRIRLETAGAWGILLYLAFVSAAAYSLWAMLLKHNPVSKVTVFGFLNPMCGVIISGIVLHEENAFGLVGILALLLVCAGIFVVNFEHHAKEKTEL
ncbi:MAG: DMT family transporter [Oscillospiraceae bacterium]|nr:DMT family transporter [Oscillospiraceae bacterium]